jgi:HEAT repeat protein
MNLKRGAQLALSFSLLIGCSFNCTKAQSEQYRQADVQAAIKALSSEDPMDRKTGSFHLSEMGPVAKDAVKPLIQVLTNDSSPTVKGEASNALGHIGAEAAPAIPAIIAFLQSSDGGYERTYAASALGDIGVQPELSVPILIVALQKDSEPVVRQMAARALAAFGADAKSAVPALIESIKTGNKDLREAAAYGLERIPCAPKDVPALTGLLHDDIDCARIAAAKSLGGAGSEAVGAVPQLITLLSDNNSDVKMAAVLGLGGIGTSAKEAIPALKQALKDPQIAYDAKQAIARINQD